MVGSAVALDGVKWVSMINDSNDNPYAALAPRSVWRKAVAETHPLQLQDLYRRKFTVPREARIATAGSCFAQHIAHSLRRHGFNFRDFEPAPPLFPAAMAQSYNYGVYSARFCNIYTARQLLQLFDRAFGRFAPEEQPWEKAGGVVDPFRPLLEPEPFGSVAELERSRQSHLSAVREMFQSTDVFIFTLGLTEAWLSKQDGAVFPLCPGTVAGRFDAAQYEFKNFSYHEIFDDLATFLTQFRQLNPSVKIIFTVSPVPLTATKSDNHVLVATNYSKSVLRAVSGYLAQELDFVDYFPSYDIITAASVRGMFYDANVRTVNASGVDYVMSHFFKEHAPSQGQSSSTAQDAAALVGNHEAVCEEMMQAQGLGYA
ncbi:hypothetical protein H4S14_000830 [Agrobacterium vitis]|nr:hypothetical protein [Agrobacterium vitis]MBE1437103.1 hypothetical protein [Agrobacterium vitis]